VDEPPGRDSQAQAEWERLYLKDQREGNFYLVWREGERKQYEPVPGRLSDAIQKKERKELYLASVAKGLRVEDPTATSSRLNNRIGYQ